MEDMDEETGLPVISLREVAHHDQHDDGWMAIYDRVYQVTDFLNQVS